MARATAKGTATAKKAKPASTARARATAKAKATPTRPAVHTVPHGDGWANRREGSTRVAKTFARKADAQAAGRRTAQREKTEHIVYKRDGSIASRNSYA
ncbi:MAG TPA: DUF2188 domain-containing protein [Acidimicrobiales bacterium]|jgi:hypothetical protein